jgi:hypothetical protein
LYFSATQEIIRYLGFDFTIPPDHCVPIHIGILLNIYRVC